MRGEERRQRAMLMIMEPGDRVPREHPLRRVKELADAALGQLSVQRQLFLPIVLPQQGIVTLDVVLDNCLFPKRDCKRLVFSLARVRRCARRVPCAISVTNALHHGRHYAIAFASR
jgi:hypothetical protein